MLEYLRAWIATRLNLDQQGAAATEYVLLILGVVLFMIVAAFGLRDVLKGAVDKITTWINAVQTPPPPTP
jgi:Flp pilus assembly pilin Flp